MRSGPARAIHAPTWRHHWRPRDVVLWDNRCTMHRRDPFDPTTRRVMHRTQIKDAQESMATAAGVIIR